MITAHISIGL